MFTKCIANNINAEYALARTSIVDSANHILNVGRMLTEKKAELGHGNFIPWIEAECDFTRQAAHKMMKTYLNVNSGLHLTETDALQISRQTWGNTNGSVVENTYKSVTDQIENLEISDIATHCFS